MHSRHSKQIPSNYLQMEMPEGMMIPPKFMNEYINNVEKSKGVSNPGANRRSTQQPQDGPIHWTMNLQNSSIHESFYITLILPFSFYFNRISMILRIVILRNKTVSSRYCVCIVKYLVYIYIYIFIVYRIFIYHLFDFYKKIYVHAWDLIRTCVRYIYYVLPRFWGEMIEEKHCNVHLDGKYNPWKTRWNPVSRFAIESMRRDQICLVSKPLLVFQGLLRGYRQRNLEVSLRACKW